MTDVKSNINLPLSQQNEEESEGSKNIIGTGKDVGKSHEEDEEEEKENHHHNRQKAPLIIGQI